MKVDDFCRTFGVEYIYHFTDEASLPSIQRHGLVPYSILTRKCWGPVRSGGNETSHARDSRSGLDEYVHLCFIRDHPMSHVAVKEGRIKSIVWLEVSHQVLSWQGVLGCSTIANRTDACLLPIEQALDTIDLQKLFSKEDSTISMRKAQILVPGSIPVRKLRGVGDG